MTYVIMALDECGSETNCGYYNTEDEAFKELPKMRELCVEYRRFWVELLKDSSYYYDLYAMRQAQGYDHPEDIYADEY